MVSIRSVFVYVHGAGEGSIELFSVDEESGDKILLNDPTDERSVLAYRPDTSAAVVTLVPGINAEGVSASTSVSVVIAHNLSNLDTNTIRLTLDGASAAVAIISGSDTNYVQARYQPSSPLTDGNHSASVIFGAGPTELVTNQWSFNVGLAAEIKLSIVSGANGLTISWVGGGTLQQSLIVSGGWTDLDSSGSIVISPVEPARFYRVRRS